MLRATVTLPYLTNIPRDVTTNTFHFGITTSEADLVASWLVEFYNDSVPSGPTIAALLSTHISRAADACTVEVYELDDPEPRVPVHIEPFTLGPATAGGNLPAEVALCASYQAPAEAGLPQARRRGRIFLGPFKATVATSTSGEPARPNASVLVTIAEACERLAGKEGLGGGGWSVYSRVNDTSVGVTNGWVNNEFDTQRRRQPSPTAREVWSISV